MDINLDRFLTITALLAAAGMTGCTTSSEDTSANADATPPATADATVTPDTGAKADAALDQASGDVSVESSTGTEASTEASTETSTEAAAACLGDEGADAAVTQSTACDDLVFPSSEGCTPKGTTVCYQYGDRVRAAVFAQMLACLKGVSAVAADASDACSTDPAAVACMDDAFAKACPALSPGDAGPGCADVVASCSPGNDSGTNVDGGAGITAAQCEKAMRPFTAAAIGEIIDCYQTKLSWGDQACETILTDCIASPSVEG
jgi:hypothetical protein